MGCDIHICLEVKNRDGEWEDIELYKKNHYKDEPNFEKVDVYHDRNYSLFAALCGVRDNSPGTPRISDPKGMPNDLSEVTEQEYIDCGDDGHSHNWNMLSELYEFQANNKIIRHSGLVTQEASTALDNGVMPSIWCQWSTDVTKVIREWEEEHDILSPLIEAIENQVNKVTWIWDAKGNSDQIRIVYWFDN